MRRLPKGDGHPVIVLPGHTCTDAESEPLRALLIELGYDAHGWGLGRNDGPSSDLDADLLALPDAFTTSVSLIGISLGGVYARAISRKRPGRVRRVITLGAPLQQAGGFASPSPLIPGIADRDRPPVRVPTTAIVARFDQFVDPAHAVLEHDPSADNVTVVGGHCGMEMNPLVVRVIADRLAA